MCAMRQNKMHNFSLDSTIKNSVAWFTPNREMQRKVNEYTVYYARKRKSLQTYYYSIKFHTAFLTLILKDTSFTSNRVKLRLWFTWRSPDIHLMFTWPPDHQLTFPWPSPDPYLTLVRRFELHLKFTWHSPGFPLHSPDFQVTTWLSSDLPLTLTRPLPNID